MSALPPKADMLQRSAPMSAKCHLRTSLGGLYSLAPRHCDQHAADEKCVTPTTGRGNNLLGGSLLVAPMRSEKH